MMRRICSWSLYAQSQSDAKLVTKVQKLNYDAMIERLDLGSMIYPEYLTAQYIIQYVRARQNSIGSNIENLYKLMDGRAEALEFHIQKGSPVIGRPIKDLLLIDNLLICSIYRKGKPMIPNGQDHMEEDDLVVVVTTKKGLHECQRHLKERIMGAGYNEFFNDSIRNRLGNAHLRVHFYHFLV